MPRLTLRYPIRTVDNQLLFPPFPPGTVLTEEMLNAVIHSYKANSYQPYPLLSYGSVKEDCLNFISTPPYDAIFSDKKQVNDLFSLLETVQLSAPVLQSLDYFRQSDLYTYTHILMVFALSSLLAKDLIPSYQERVKLSATGPTHDIGKICVPLHILKKTTPLTKTERDFIEHHTVAGYVLLGYYYKDIRHLASKVALDHHKRRDGSGYPQGMMSQMSQDPLVEVIAVSDIYDALIRPRSYRSTAFDNRTALEEITSMAEQNKIGWDVVKALIAHNRKSKPYYGEITIPTEKRGTPPPNNIYGKIADGEKGDPKD